MSGSVGRWLGVAALMLGSWGCDDADGGGDAPCPEDTVRSGNTCVPDPTGRTDGTTGDDQGTPDRGVTDAAPDAGAELALPIIVDDHFAPSGFMGDGETGGIVADADCPMRAGESGGACHRFAYTPGALGFGGVFWQSPDGNWGDAPGLAVPAGATRVQFYAWGAAGGESVRFVTGYGEADGFAVETAFAELTDTPTLITLDLAGVPYSDIAGGLAWFAEAGVTFYMDDIRIVADPADVVNPCTVSCATLQGLGECEGKVGYTACADQCAARRAGDCSAQIDGWLTCVGADGWVCDAGTAAPANGCAAERDALVACEGDAPAAPLPFYIEEHFTMSGFMGGGDVETAPCEDDIEGGCLRITWTPGDAEWVGFFFQYPENNWGELPGLRVADGATHIRYRAWGEVGGERANFAAGIADVDSFNVESGYTALGTEPTNGVLSIPPGVDEVTGGFAWFLEANGAESVTFYLDDVQWRDDLPPGGAQGCTDETASNYNPAADQDDGSCAYPVAFTVDMNCTEDPFETVFITGPFCEWCADGFELLDADGDGVYTGTWDFPMGPLEFKFMVDNFDGQENLVDDVAAGNGACAPVTDGAEFANRQIDVMGAQAVDAVYGQCLACGEEPPPPPEGDFETITFDDADTAYALVGFGGAEDSGVVVDPTNAANRVGRVTKSDMAEVWGGVTVATQANDAAGRIPFDAQNVRMTVRVWSPDAGIQVRLKVEDAAAAAVSVETEATTTVANDWEELTFDFTRQADGTAAINFGATYDKVSIFFNFGVPGAEAGAKTYYFDDVTFIGGLGEEPPPPAGPFDVTFQVDMNCTEDPFEAVFVTGPFCEWCAEGFALNDDDGDGIWAGTFAFDGGPLEYKYMVDNFAGQEDLLDDVQAGDGACAAVTDGVNFANRQFQLDADATRTEVYGQCAACGDDPLPPIGGFETVTFEDADTDYALTGFGGAEDSAVVVDPTDDGNTVARVTKNDAAEVWAGVTVATQANDAVGRMPFDAANVRMTVMVWSPDAGIQVRIKVEDATDPTVSVETEATTTVAGNWEELTFDFSRQADGTAAINFASTYDKASIFFNFGVTGAEAGAKTYYFDDLTFIGGVGGDVPPPAGGFAPITFDDPDTEYVLAGFGGAEDSAVVVDPVDGADMVARVTKNAAAELWAGVTVSTQANNAVGRMPFDAANVRMTVMVWSPDAGIQVRLKVEDATDPTVSVETEATTTVANAWEELTFDFSDEAAGTAAINFASTYDKASIFFNFGVTGVEAGGAKTYYFDDLTFIGGGGEVIPPLEDFDPITFDDPDTEYALTGFGGAEDSAVVIDPTDDANMVARVTKNAAAELWAGVTVSTEANDAVGRMPFDAANVRMTVMVWSPDAGIQVRIKVEDATDPTVSVETEATTTVAGDWEELTFDFSQQAVGTAAINFESTYDKASIFFNFGVTGAEAGGAKTYYFDDLTFIGGVGGGDVPPPAGDFEAITFDDPDTEYALTGFGGAASEVIVDPTDDTNMVARVNKGVAAELWAGVTMASRANLAVGRMPFDADNVRMTVRVWSPAADIPVRVKVEDATDPTVSVETEATTTVAGAWEELTFNFTQETPGTAAINFASTYDRASIFFNFGVTGAEAGAQTYYFDDVTFIGGVDE